MSSKEVKIGIANQHLKMSQSLSDIAQIIGTKKSTKLTKKIKICAEKDITQLQD